uniref:Uncharacterized protein n=1 Tax=Utricularia reniformis TaxID=192314 RepID=A0A1Y0B1Y4_9LAMI|nr:hypothetical protein AEK19_MT1198 [Utricularia reniformis]ART31410.1 hypothetical protein AEK19_MT1198 [Utricularia reniformis]
MYSRPNSFLLVGGISWWRRSGWHWFNARGERAIECFVLPSIG